MRVTKLNLRNSIRKEISALKEYRSNTFMLSRMESDVDDKLLDDDLDECGEDNMSPGHAAVISSSPNVWKTSTTQDATVKDFVKGQQHKNMMENKKTGTLLLKETKVGKNVMLTKQRDVKFKKIAEDHWQCIHEINEKQILSLIEDITVANVIKDTIYGLSYIDLARGSLAESLRNSYPTGLTFVRKENGMFQEVASYSDNRMNMILEQTHKMITLSESKNGK